MDLWPLDYEGGSLDAGGGTAGRGGVQSRTANARTQSRPLPILPGACHAAGSGPANERPTNDQWHDHHAGRSCHLPATTWSGWPDLNRRPLRPETSRQCSPGPAPGRVDRHPPAVCGEFEDDTRIAATLTGQNAVQTVVRRDRHMACPLGAYEDRAAEAEQIGQAARYRSLCVQGGWYGSWGMYVRHCWGVRSLVAVVQIRLMA
jgi:hypothetical protein